MMTPLAEKWRAACAKSRLAIGIAPRIAEMPAPIARFDDPFLPFGRAVIEATSDLVCAYVFDLASYFRLGAAGIRALERTIPVVPREIVTILHAPFVTADYAVGAFEDAFFVDSVTLAVSSAEVIHAYTDSLYRGAFLLRGLDTPSIANLGIYDLQSLSMVSQQAVWITDEIIYASRLHDFQDSMRQKASQFHHTLMRS
jgi:hypothetical protein